MNAESFPPFLCDLFAKSALILLLAAVVVRLWRGSTAAQRHFVWFAAIVAVVLLPMTWLLRPQWTIPFLRMTAMTLPAKAHPHRAHAISEVPLDSSMLLPPSAAGIHPDWREVLLGTWLGGVGLLIGYRWLLTWRMHLLHRSSLPPNDARIRAMAGKVLRELNIKHAVEIRVSDECRVPMTWGILRTVLLLPVDAATWSDDRLMTALRHESGHILHRDYLVRWLAHLACALYWPNPLIWFAARSLRVAQEQTTDDLVLRAGTPPDEYAAQLFDAARAVGGRGFFTPRALAMASPSTLEARVLAILDSERARRPLGPRAATAGSLVVALTLAISAAARLQGADGVPALKEPNPALSQNPKVAKLESQLHWLDGLQTGELSEEQLRPLYGDPIIASDLSRLETVVIEKKSLTESLRLWTSKSGSDGPQVKSLAAAKENILKEIDHLLSAIRESLSNELRQEKEKPRQASETATQLITKEWKLPRGVITHPNSPDAFKTSGEYPSAAPKSAIEWLTAHGVSFSPSTDRPANDLKASASALYIDRTSRLIVRNTPDQLDLVDHLVDAAWKAQPAGKSGDADSKSPPTTPAPVTENPLLAEAAAIIIPKVELREASVAEAIDFLRQKSIEADPAKHGIKITLQPGTVSNAKLTLSLTNIPLIEALRYVTGLSDLEVAPQPDGLVIRRPGGDHSEPVK